MTAAATEPRILGLDIGLRRTGVALSDPGRTLATPLETVTLAPGALIPHLCGLVLAHAVDCVVIGLPRMASGDEGEVAALARRVGAALALATGVSILFRDEALTSWEAGEILGRAGRRPGPPGRRGRRGRGRDRRAGEIDRVAAALILQEYLDERRPGPGMVEGEGAGAGEEQP